MTSSNNFFKIKHYIYPYRNVFITKYVVGTIPAASTHYALFSSLGQGLGKVHYFAGINIWIQQCTDLDGAEVGVGSLREPEDQKLCIIISV